MKKLNAETPTHAPGVYLLHPRGVMVHVLWKEPEGFPHFGLYRISPVPGQNVEPGECFAARHDDLKPKNEG